jgi:hypothetical protein
MAKALLAEFRIGGDVIDRLAPQAAPRVRDSVTSLPPTTVGNNVTAEAKSAGGSREDAPVAGEEGDAGAAASQELIFERDGLFHRCTIGMIDYRVGGVRQLFVTSLKVNIRVSCRDSAGWASYYDSLDLYAAKARAGFAQAVARSFGVELARVEKDLVLILERLERERDEALSSGSRTATVTLSAADRELGALWYRLLMSPATSQASTAAASRPMLNPPTST